MASADKLFSQQVYGREIITVLADKLWTGPNGSPNNPHPKDHYDYGFAYRHRDYCGVGLAFVNGILKMQEVYDGYFMNDTDLKIYMTWKFDEKGKFVDLMSAQSDFTLSGFDSKSMFVEDDVSRRGNQRISLDRIRAFIRAETLMDGWNL